MEGLELITALRPGAGVEVWPGGVVGDIFESPAVLRVQLEKRKLISAVILAHTESGYVDEMARRLHS